MSSQLVRHPGPGCIVEYMQGNQPVAGFVIEDKSGRLKVLTHSGREAAVPTARLLPWSGPVHEGVTTRSGMEETLRRHVDERARLEGEIDALALWEMAQGEVENA